MIEERKRREEKCCSGLAIVWQSDKKQILEVLAARHGCHGPFKLAHSGCVSSLIHSETVGDCRSDEVELGVALLEVTVDHGWLLVATATLANKGCQAMRIADAGRLLDGARDVVVVVAQLERQQLHLVGGRLHCVEQHREASGRRHALSGRHGHQVELVSVAVGHRLVNDSSGSWILEAAGLTCEDTRVYPLAAVDVHELAGVDQIVRGDSLLNLLDLRHADALDLAFAHTITIEDYSSWRGTVLSLEGLQSISHACLQVRGSLLADLVLDHARGPVGCRRLVHRSSESQDRFLAKCCRVEHVHPTNHCWLFHEGQVVHCPGHAAHLSIHLDQHLGDD